MCVCSRAKPKWSGEVVKKKTEKDSTSTMKRNVMAIALSRFFAVTVYPAPMNEKMKFVEKIIAAKNTAPRIERSHWRLTPAKKTNGSCSRKSVIRGKSSQKTIAIPKIAHT
jgi:hypothetical protein